MVPLETMFVVLDGEPEMRKAFCSLAAILYPIIVLEALCRRARQCGGYPVRASLAWSCRWVQDFKLLSEKEVHGAGLLESVMTAPGC